MFLYVRGNAGIYYIFGTGSGTDSLITSLGGVDGLLERIPAVAETPAGQHRRIVDMSDTEVLSFGPRSPAVLDALARAIYAPTKAE